MQRLLGKTTVQKQMVYRLAPFRAKLADVLATPPLFQEIIPREYPILQDQPHKDLDFHRSLDPLVRILFKILIDFNLILVYGLSGWPNINGLCLEAQSLSSLYVMFSSTSRTHHI